MNSRTSNGLYPDNFILSQQKDNISRFRIYSIFAKF